MREACDGGGMRVMEEVDINFLSNFFYFFIFIVCRITALTFISRGIKK